MPTGTRNSSLARESTLVLVLVIVLLAVLQSVPTLQAFVISPTTTSTANTLYGDRRYLIPTTLSYNNNNNKGRLQPAVRPSRITFSRRFVILAASPNVDSTDPFKVLGLDPSPGLDKKEIKRAYKRLALKFHPDVVTNLKSSAQEKKAASDVFAKINWAYETLSGKNGASSPSSSTASSSSSSSGTASSGWKPPHRRTSDYTGSTGSSSSSSSGGPSTDWRDYMPNYGINNDDDAKYDAGGDSFGSIFSDLFNGASTAAAYTTGASGGVFRDFVEFLESNVDGYSPGGNDDDAQLRILLQTGTLQEIGDEMDDTDLVVKQLGSKLTSVQNELVMLQAEVNAAVAMRYMEKLELEERVAELKARKKVVEGYITKARKRLLSLQTRYKQLIVDGGNDSKAGGGRSSRRTSAPSSSSRNEPGVESYSAAGYRSTSAGSSSSSKSTSTSSSGSSYTAPSDSSSRSTSTSTPNGSAKNDEDAWKNDSFGSSGRGRSSSSRQRSRQRTSTTPPPEPTRTTTSSSSSSTSGTAPSESSNNRSTSASTPTGSANGEDAWKNDSFGSFGRGRSSSSRQRSRQQTSTTAEPTGSTSSSSSSTAGSSQVPPHRRQSSSPRDKNDTQRLRELKVDEEFDKLKKELGL
jgi:hypothetical protein